MIMEPFPQPIGEERRGVMDIVEWIIKLAIFGVLAIAVIGTVQNILRDFKGRKSS
jgi:hypothetical protein